MSDCADTSMALPTDGKIQAVGFGSGEDDDSAILVKLMHSRHS